MLPGAICFQRFAGVDAMLGQIRFSLFAAAYAGLRHFLLPAMLTIALSPAL